MSLATYSHRFTPGTDGRTLVLLHGTGGDKESFDALGAALAPTAARLALDGDVDEMGMKRFFRRLGEGRYDMADLERRTAAFDAFLGEAFAAFDVDGAQAAGVGYSNGANLLANLALAGSRRLPRLALMHPLIPFEPMDPPDLAGVDILVTAGRRDPICPPPLTEQLIRTLRASGAETRLVWHEGGHEVPPAELEAVAAFLSAR